MVLHLKPVDHVRVESAAYHAAVMAVVGAAKSVVAFGDSQMLEAEEAWDRFVDIVHALEALESVLIEGSLK
jgi:hypothetical protein